jgi:hypothetical protein
VVEAKELKLGRRGPHKKPSCRNGALFIDFLIIYQLNVSWWLYLAAIIIYSAHLWRVYTIYEDLTEIWKAIGRK